MIWLEDRKHQVSNLKANKHKYVREIRSYYVRGRE